MIVTHIRIENFRNHGHTDMEFSSGINAILGDNGQGKTNLLEAISYLSLTKSFYAASDANVLQIGKEEFEIEGNIAAAAGTDHRVRIVYIRSTGEKTITVNQVRPEKLTAVIGQFPVVILSPENSAITFGGPSDRRKFIDLLLSQVSRVYFEDLLEYRRVLRQRNRILFDAKVQGNDVSRIIEPWSISLAQYGGRIMQRRSQFIREFRSYVTGAYEELVQQGEKPDLEYVPMVSVPEGSDPEAMGRALMYEMENRRVEEARRGLTLVGPHRDDLKMQIDGISVQHFASQGQHKTFLVALKVAEFFYLRERRSESPLFLLDDIFSELDAHRAKHILGLIGGLGQAIITATDESAFRGGVEWNGANRRFCVEHGLCRVS